MSVVEILRGVDLFSGLTEEELEAVAGALSKRSFAKGVYIFHQGSPGRVMYLIESGRVRIFALSDMGQEISIDVYGAGEIFGEMALLDSQPRSAGAVCLEATAVWTLNQEDLNGLLGTCPRLAKNLLRILSGRLRHTAGYAEDLAFLDVTGRVAIRLLDLAERNGVEGCAEIDMSLTQVELATWVAASRESVNKTLNIFRARGLIAMDDGRIAILDRRGLEAQIRY